MNVLTEDQVMLAESMRAVLTKKSDVRAAMESPDRYDRSLWTYLCEQIGVGGLTITEDHGGSAGSLTDAAVVAEEMGRMLVPSPLLGSSGLAATLVAATTDADAQARLLPAIADGTTIVSVCIADDRGSWVGGSVGVRAQEGDGWSLTGSSHYVLDAAAADTFVVAATTDAGVALFELGAHAPGVAVTDGGTMDPTRPLYVVTFEAASARHVACDDPSTALQRATTWATVLLAAEQVGAAARCLDLTVDYTLSRSQFGRPLASFQALAHRMADLHVLVRSARAAAFSAAEAVARSGDGVAEASIAKVWCSDAFTAVAAECVQLHGGMAITWEHDMQLYFKRAHSSAYLFGSPREHVASLAESAGLVGGLPPS
ncbi:acyl-CoA dehydrogenase family protein [Rhodococcoides kyotonense]|uniref:Acyl-CoA dehydrogenase n=1 Tax=Rhodococcoides kyotonense TaxID=398843 RepID=A0A239JVA6_9NOCA|nr:acyl-CoA dehydrogenase family protein [Rhodococcus kyotonensis]SNT09482.1 Acyl-CoA dehydrogenase [Rhodococcus kyotonensis]